MLVLLILLNVETGEVGHAIHNHNSTLSVTPCMQVSGARNAPDRIDEIPCNPYQVLFSHVLGNESSNTV